MIITGISEYSTPMYATFKATVTLNNGTVNTSDSHPSRFWWNHQDNDFELLEDNGSGVFALTGQGKSGYVGCNYFNGSTQAEATHYVKFVVYNDTYTFVAARLVRDRTENGYDYYHVDIKCKNQNNVERIFQVEGNTFEVNGVDALLSWDCVEGGLWSGSTNVVPAGTTIRVGLTVNGVNRGYVGLTW